MKIFFLGTGAAEGFPALFCNCSSCKKARELKGRNIRTRSSLLIDNILKIDFSADAYFHLLKYNLDYTKLKYLLISHSHNDHFNVGELEYLSRGFMINTEFPKIKIFGNRNVIKILKDYLAKILWDKYNGICTYVKPFEEFEIEPYKIISIKAVHGADEEPLNYIIQKGNKSILYTCDTGYYEEESWTALKNYHIDVGIVECTNGPKRVDYKHHMGIPNFLEFRKKCEEIGFADSKTKWICTHFSHSGGMIYNELVKYEKEYNLTIAYDGYEVVL